MKLNYKRTFLIGFAFFGILLLWQVYDSWCPTFLTDIFARRFYGMSSAALKASDPEHILHVQWIVGIINIMGYIGGAFATVLGLFLVLSNYINAPDAERNLWVIELPFIIASVLMVISALVLFATIKENKIEQEMAEELAPVSYTHLTLPTTPYV